MKLKISAAAFISLGHKLANLVSFISVILCCLICSVLITFQDFYTCFRRIFQLISYLIRDFYNIFPSKRPCRIGETNAYDHITREDIEIVMENLGLVQEPLSDSLEVENLFDHAEPCLDEVREAFRVFDKDRDGFIEAGELKKVVNSIGLTAFSEEECQRMIMAYDDNRDGRIDFDEFVKMMEECFC